ncbi:ZP domain-containing protein-like [Conger conger]|nr:ZP domain-containing protein-like [Conger conger]
MASYTLLLLLASCCGALASQHYAGVMTFTPKGKNADGSFRRVNKGNATVICTETTMRVEVEKASIIGLHEDHLRLNDPSCTPTSNQTHVIATVSLGSCGTVLEEDADNLIFKNEIMSFDNVGDVITRKHQVEIDFVCCYPKKSRVYLDFQAHKIPYVFTEKAFGKFTYQFEFFHSELFNTAIDTDHYPVDVALKEVLYMQIKATSSVANTVLFVESCRATPVDDPDYHISYDIISNGCILDGTVVVYPSNSTEYRFGMEAFQFIGQHEQVFICCSVILCVAGEPGTRCSQGCTTPTPTPAPVLHHHHRRDAATQTGRHSISQGPLRLKKATETTVSNMGLNMNLVFIAAFLLVVVVIVCGAVIYTVKRPTLKYQPLPSTDF